ncbi:DEAD/DEAH box helicase [Comamonas testosteroni]|uniref:DEAD/DEAH box helicase n=1 Tax=Comamonas testosteroni TaxID=285 RepID=A0A373FG69_COMTE|nr:DEAD/DEAH box helicase [Comamonas testosteroni]RGE42399.1 DEAD/DEAH box helicase [Comamonas testosteroni]
MSFATLGLRAELLNAAQSLSLLDATPIQTQSIPAVLAGRDLWACAPTGSGKTMAYLMPLLQNWLTSANKRGHSGFVRPLSTLILVPTRELALQVHENLSDLVRQWREQPRSRVVYGGVSINPQMMQLRGSADFLVATPGRLLDLADNNAVRLNTVQHLVLDEADRLLDQGFADELNRVLALLPAKRQTLLFSATFPQNVEALAEKLLHDPVRVQVDADAESEHSASPDNISQRAIAVDGTRRTQLLRQLIKDGEGQPEWERALVFVAKRHTAEMLADKLYKNGIYATTFHGDMSQGARKDVLDQFKAKRWQLLITTDLAARGIDIAQLPTVINYDLPRSPADYIHRIGRTGRAGHAGSAITLVTPADTAHWKLICKRNQLDIALEQVPGFEPTEEVPPPPVAQDGNGGIKGRRPSKKDKLRAAAAAQLQHKP